MEFQEGQELTLQDLVNWFKIFGQILLNYIRSFLIYDVGVKNILLTKKSKILPPFYQPIISEINDKMGVIGVIT